MEFSKRNVRHAFYYNIRMGALHPKCSFDKISKLYTIIGKILLHLLNMY